METRLVNSRNASLLDLDHVLTRDGQIYRVVGNLDSRTQFLGYNVYSPNMRGERFYRGNHYRKNFAEDAELPADVLDTYRLIDTEDIVEHHDPIASAMSKSGTFKETIWFDLYVELVRVFGKESVGIFGSSMLGLHLTRWGDVRKDIDFVIQGMGNIELLRLQLPIIREMLGFSAVSTTRQLQQHARYQRVFRNPNNSIGPIIARRWTGLQLSEQVVSTIRLRDPAVMMPVELVTPSSDGSRDVIVSGQVVDADSSNLFPRAFGLITPHGRIEIYILWWKFSTPVRDGDAITLCGSLISGLACPTIRLTNFARHWLSIHELLSPLGRHA